MRKIMILMTILMGFTMSLILSLLGTFMGGHFTVPSWLISFGLSFVISLIIGFSVPVKKIGDSACAKCNANPESFKGNLISSTISDLIYTPVITIVMVCVMVGNARKHAPAAALEHMPTVIQVLIPSLICSLLVGLIVIFITQPLYIKMLTRGKKGPRPETTKEN